MPQTLRQYQDFTATPSLAGCPLFSIWILDAHGYWNRHCASVGLFLNAWQISAKTLRQPSETKKL
jgi:hypothetical protein